MHGMFETFEHTADIGLRARARDLNGLFADAAHAMFSVMVANPQDIRPIQASAFSLPADEPDALLRRWLAELLYAFHVRRMLFCQYEITVAAAGASGESPWPAMFSLEAVARGEPIDSARHRMDVEIKAVTWHGLRLEREADGWLAEVIVDV
jgi:SHS2 domain-containing protein